MTTQTDNHSTVRAAAPVSADDEFLTVRDVAERLRVHTADCQERGSRAAICARSGSAEPSASGGWISRRCWSARGSRQRMHSPRPEVLRFEPSGARPVPAARYWHRCRPVLAACREAVAAGGERSFHEANTASPARQAARAQAAEAARVAAANPVHGGHGSQRVGRRRAQLHRLRSRSRIDPAHLIPEVARRLRPRALRYRPCRPCHRAYDRGELDLLPYLEPGVAGRRSRTPSDTSVWSAP